MAFLISTLPSQAQQESLLSTTRHSSMASLSTSTTPYLSGFVLSRTSGLPKSLWGKALRHATWLKNQTAMHSLDGKTPFEALYSRPPDLSALCTWGFPVLVHSPDGSKLDVCAQEARWLGFDVDVKAHRVFWPGPGNVTVEHNVFFGASAQLKGEEQNLPVADSEQAVAPPSPSTSPVPKASNMFSHAETPTPTHTSKQEPPAEPPAQLRHSTHLQKPSCIVRNLQSREGVPHVPGLQIPGSLVEEPEEAGGAWSVHDGTPTLLENFDGLEHMFLTETADAEALEPWSLTEARR